MPLYDFECPQGHRFERVAKMSTEVTACPICEEQGIANNAKRDDVNQIRHLDKLGPDANYSSVRFHFNFVD